ncbi:CinA family protein [Fodinicurvata halophila]|uniref:CinA family protein n=1 Tax=Fodinicurvata halophila TaxID=1419723 RepID=A0ABV8UJF7_9PROT
MFNNDLMKAAAELLEHCRGRSIRLATAESCTGGLLGGLLTEAAGASDVIDCGFIVYSDQAKTELLDVSSELLERHGAVSSETAIAMAEGALARCPDAQIALSITGVAGPGGGSPDKPVGLVHFALAQNGTRSEAEHEIFSGDRHSVRQSSLKKALSMMQAAVLR